MTAFLAAALGFPTVVFSVLLTLFLAYALLVFLGALNLDWLDGLLGGDDVADDGLFDGAMNTLGVHGIPITIFGGATTLISWFLSFTGMFYLGRFVPAGIGGVAIEAGVGFACLLAGMFVASRAVRPLRPIFVTPVAQERASLVGKLCVIRSLRVDEGTGMAEIEDGAAGVIAEVRCLRDNELTHGSRALVYDYDPKEGVYRVGPLDRALEQPIEV